MSSDAKRSFAHTIVLRLRESGYQALWAGGCVRDQVLGRTPKDYDVATTATPDQVIALFGKRRTVAVGASFGVVMVLGNSKADGQVEVATFRTDGEYSDGRRPNSVQFCSPEEDARRRDFTINGMFYDPVLDQVIDYVGGHEDLQRKVVRAIGNAHDRFTEDKLRMLRAVRFAATFRFALDPDTAKAVHTLRRQLNQVSVERIMQELRRMLAHETRAHALELMYETELLPEILPELFNESAREITSRPWLVAAFNEMVSEDYEPAMALLLQPLHDPALSEARRRLSKVQEVCRRLKMSNDEIDAICWILDSAATVHGISKRPLHVIKPLLSSPHQSSLLAMLHAVASARGESLDDIQFCRAFLEQHTPAELNPEPFVNGQDVQTLGVPPGPSIRHLLSTIRNEQLDGQLNNRDEALQRLKELIAQLPW